jgi:hypothetical protein
MPRENFRKQSVGHKIVGKNEGIDISINDLTNQRSGRLVDRATEFSARN